MIPPVSCEAEQTSSCGDKLEGEGVEALVAGLTRAQRAALLEEAIFEGGITTVRWQYRITPACRCALQRKGIWKNRMYSTEYTPLGIAVRAALTARTPQMGD